MQKTSRKNLVCAILTALAWTGAIDHASADARAAVSADGTTQYSDRLSPETGVALTLPSERAAITSSRMQGRWLARSEDGFMTVLELRPGGGFSFDRQTQLTPEREYMC